MEHPDQRPDEVSGIGIGTQIAAVNRALNQVQKCAVDDSARAFDEAQGSARDGIHGGNNQPFVGHMVDKEKHPRAQGRKRRHGGRKARSSLSQFFHFAAVDGLNQIVPRRKVTVERTWPDARLPRDVVERSLGSVPGEGALGNLQDALTIALRIRAWLAR